MIIFPPSILTLSKVEVLGEIVSGIMRDQLLEGPKKEWESVESNI